MSSEAYRRAGVDLDAAARAVELIRELGGGASRPELVEGVGGFAGLFEIGDGRFLAAATDGVGTKLEIARRAGRLDTVGIDLVAMCADDVVCTGAEPLFFLDYLAVGSVEPERVAAIVAGVAEGCRRAGCALLGGETAEHPGVMAPDAFDLAGFCVGVVEQERRLGPDLVQDGDVLIGLASSGLHANGFSLVRDALLERGGYALDGVVPPLRRPLVDELLEPTAIYAPLVLGLGREGLLHAAAHVTGGGIVENLPRVLPDGSRGRRRVGVVARTPGVRAAARRDRGVRGRPAGDLQPRRRDGARRPARPGRPGDRARRGVGFGRVPHRARTRLTRASTRGPAED